MIVRSGRRLRAIATGAAVAAAVALGALVSPTATAAPVAPEDAAQDQSAPGAWAPADTAAIRPGVVTETAGAGACTSNFVFTSGERTFIGQAAHCAGTGDTTEIDGCISDTLPLGTPVTVRGTDGSARAGTLAYSSWVTMQQVGETDPSTCMFNDFALVELEPADVADVNPSVPFFGGPEGLDTDGVPAGEQVFTYGNSPLRMGVEPLSPKVGASAGDVGEGWGHQVFTVTAGVPGDSGSAFLDSDGDAMGVLSTLVLAPLPASNGVGDLAKALDYANANGNLGDIALERGTEPFTSLPAGVPLTDLAGPAGPPLPGL